MNKKEYSTKEIIFGLRSESQRLKSKLEDSISLLTYDNELYRIEPFIDKKNKLYLNATLRKEKISYLKSLKYLAMKTKSISTPIDEYKGHYEILWPDGFPARISSEHKDEFTKLIDEILTSTKENMFDNKSQYRLENITYTPSIIDIKSASNNIFPYECIYQTQDDTLTFKSEYEDISKRLIRRILESTYNEDLLTSKAKKLIEESTTSTLDTSIIDSKDKKESTYIIDELPNRLVLSLKK